jgi:hypothetical protein
VDGYQEGEDGLAVVGPLPKEVVVHRGNDVAVGNMVVVRAVEGEA